MRGRSPASASHPIYPDMASNEERCSPYLLIGPIVADFNIRPDGFRRLVFQHHTPATQPLAAVKQAYDKSDTAGRDGTPPPRRLSTLPWIRRVDDLERPSLPHLR